GDEFMRSISKLLIVFILCSMVFVGCSNNKKEDNSKEEKVVLNDSKEESLGNEATKEESKEEINSKEDNNKVTNNQKKESSKSKGEEEVFTIYDVDGNTYNKKVAYTFNLPSDKSIEEKAEIIIKKTIAKWFNSLPIDISFKKVDSKNIMVLNLIDKNKDSRDSWYRAFQGSTGGTINSTRLIENSLQKSYKGEWIDGLEVLYNGKTSEFQHAWVLSEIVYR
ncbi:hypothetical protein, partial [Clostridium sp.]|uniref:hypothetical protein n=1 Tax=Clostridium sp. TaxID=1506 RepID=UPI003463FE49